MGVEIERKFLVAGDGWRRHVTKTEALKQGYLASNGGVTVRIRTIDDQLGLITVKGGGSTLSRAEFEYEIPIEDARQLLKLCHGVEIDKRRYTLDLAGGDWVVDAFAGRHSGLVLAEVELEHAEAELELPDWIGEEVTGQAAYYNSSLALLPAGGEI